MQDAPFFPLNNEKLRDTHTILFFFFIHSISKTTLLRIFSHFLTFISFSSENEQSEYSLFLVFKLTLCSTYRFWSKSQFDQKLYSTKCLINPNGFSFCIFLCRCQSVISWKMLNEMQVFQWMLTCVHFLCFSSFLVLLLGQCSIYKRNQFFYSHQKCSVFTFSLFNFFASCSLLNFSSLFLLSFFPYFFLFFFHRMH